jgi:hypothetical protein
MITIPLIVLNVIIHHLALQIRFNEFRSVYSGTLLHDYDEASTVFNLPNVFSKVYHFPSSD